MAKRVRSFRSFVKTVAPAQRDKQGSVLPASFEDQEAVYSPSGLKRSSSVYSTPTETNPQGPNRWSEVDKQNELPSHRNIFAQAASFTASSPQLHRPDLIPEPVTFLEPKTYSPPRTESTSGGGPSPSSSTNDAFSTRKASFRRPRRDDPKPEARTEQNKSPTGPARQDQHQTIKEAWWSEEVMQSSASIASAAKTGPQRKERDNFDFQPTSGPVSPTEVSPTEVSPPSPKTHRQPIFVEVFDKDYKDEDKASGSLRRGRSRRRQPPSRTRSKRSNARLVQAARRSKNPRRMVPVERTISKNDGWESESGSEYESGFDNHEISTEAHKAPSSRRQPSRALPPLPRGVCAASSKGEDFRLETTLVPPPLFWHKNGSAHVASPGMPSDIEPKRQRFVRKASVGHRGNMPRRLPPPSELPLKMTLPEQQWRDLGNGENEHGLVNSASSQIRPKLPGPPKPYAPPHHPADSVKKSKRPPELFVAHRPREKASSIGPRPGLTIITKGASKTARQRKASHPSLPRSIAAVGPSLPSPSPERVRIDQAPPSPMALQRTQHDPGDSAQKSSANDLGRGVGAWWRSNRMQERSLSDPVPDQPSQSPYAEVYGTLSPYQAEPEEATYPRLMEQAPSPNQMTTFGTDDTPFTPTRQVAARLMSNVHDALDKVRMSNPFRLAHVGSSSRAISAFHSASTRDFGGSASHSAPSSPAAASGWQVSSDPDNDGSARPSLERPSLFRVALDAKRSFERTERVRRLKREIKFVGPTDPNSVANGHADRHSSEEHTWL